MDYQVQKSEFLGCQHTLVNNLTFFPSLIIENCAWKVSWSVIQRLRIQCRPLKSNCNDVQELFGNADKWRPPEAKTCITSRVGQWFYTHLSLPLNIENASLLENTQVKK